MVEWQLTSALHFSSAYRCSALHFSSISVLHTDAHGAREVARRSSRWINDRRGAPDIYQRRTRKFIFSSEIVVSGFQPTTIGLRLNFADDLWKFLFAVSQMTSGNLENIAWNSQILYYCIHHTDQPDAYYRLISVQCYYKCRSGVLCALCAGQKVQSRVGCVRCGK